MFKYKPNTTPGKLVAPLLLVTAVALGVRSYDNYNTHEPVSASEPASKVSPETQKLIEFALNPYNLTQEQKNMLESALAAYNIKDRVFAPEQIQLILENSDFNTYTVVSESGDSIAIDIITYEDEEGNPYFSVSIPGASEGEHHFPIMNTPVTSVVTEEPLNPAILEYNY
jgi:hypothetical protein